MGDSRRLSEAMALKDTIELADQLGEENYADDQYSVAWQAWETEFGPEHALALVREVERCRGDTEQCCEEWKREIIAERDELRAELKRLRCPFAETMGPLEHAANKCCS